MMMNGMDFKTFYDRAAGIANSDSGGEGRYA